VLLRAVISFHRQVAIDIAWPMRRKSKGKRCAVEGCDKFSQTDCNRHCLAHATQEQKIPISDERKKKGKRCAVKGCNKFPQTGCNGHCFGHATQEQKNEFYNGRKKKSK
jgi:hypothetical protein